MDRQIELYLQEICQDLRTTESRKLEIKRELNSHIAEMLEDCSTEPSDLYFFASKAPDSRDGFADMRKNKSLEEINEVIRREFGEVEEISAALNAALKKGGNRNMERKGFIRRIVLPPLLVLGVFLLMLLGNKLANFIDYKPLWHVAKITTTLIRVASIIGASGIVSLLCFYQGGNLLERLLLGLISPFVVIMFLAVPETSFSAFIWILLHPIFIGIIGGAVLQMAFVEIWARYKIGKYNAASVAE